MSQARRANVSWRLRMPARSEARTGTSAPFTESGTVAVVGAGPSGLGCAVALALTRPVVVVERIPVVGGTAGWERPAIRAYAERARQLGVQFRLGETAIRWDDHQLLLTGPGTTARIDATHLFFAGGLRPATTANLGLAGDRPAGVLPATVAEHLLQAQVPLWRNVAIIGDGHWAETIARLSRRLGSRIIGVGGSAPWADEHHPRPDTWAIVGAARVSALRLSYGDAPAAAEKWPGTVSVSCDGVVLADRPLPNRNVDGAVLASARNVTFVQPVEPADYEARFDSAHNVAGTWLENQQKVDV